MWYNGGMDENRMQNMTVPGQGAQSAQTMNGNSLQGNSVQPVTQPQMQPVLGPNGQPLIGANGMPMMQASPVVQVDRSGGASGLLKTIIIIVLSLTTLAFAGLFVWKQMEYANVQGDVDALISDAVEKAKSAQREEDLAQFAEDEKSPLQTFVGPADYGQLSFEYPKTWSVYIALDATNGGDYEAYFNPFAVEAVSKTTVNALRVYIRNRSFEDVTAELQKTLNSANSGLTMSTVEINGIVMNRYVGKIPNTQLDGAFVVFKIRDKTAIVRTDATQFMGDFDTVVNTIKFNA